MSIRGPYPRDLVGYGAQSAPPALARDARIAVSIVLNYEEGGEYCMLHGDAHSESVLTDRGRRAAAECAQPQRRVEFRVRQPRRVLGDHADAARPRRAGDGVCGGHGAGAQSRGRRRRSRTAASRWPVTASAGSTISSCRRTSSAPTCCGTSRSSRVSSGAGRSAGTPAGRARTRGGWWSRRADSSTTAMPTTTTCRTGRRVGGPRAPHRAV